MNIQCFNDSINNNQYKFCHITRLNENTLYQIENCTNKNMRNNELINDEASYSTLVEGFSLS
jgi:hypothetical protein